MGQDQGKEYIAVVEDVPAEPVPSLSSEEVRKNNARRTMIVKEIVDTERSYVKALKELDERWEQPLRACLATKPVLTESEIQVIFTIGGGTLWLEG
jgi:hypothetical protein